MVGTPTILGVRVDSYVIRTGLTRRLIRADDPTDALERFRAILRGDPSFGVRRVVFEPGDVIVQPATDDDLAEFGAGRRRPTTILDGQQRWNL